MTTPFRKFAFSILFLTSGLAGTRVFPAADKVSHDKANWARYRPGTLTGIFKEIQPFIEERDSGVSAGYMGDHATRARLTYLGKIRRVPAHRAEALETCRRMVGLPDDFTRMFTSELQFREGATTYWIPVQEASIPALVSKLKAGQPVDLFVILVGIDHLGHHKADVLLVANEFRVVP